MPVASAAVPASVGSQLNEHGNALAMCDSGAPSSGNPDASSCITSRLHKALHITLILKRPNRQRGDSVLML